MKLARVPSLIDGRDGLALHYPPNTRFPWNHVVDELRRIDDTSLLGMTVPDINGLRDIALPFVLQKS
jgi:hypothetical protein